MTEEEEKTGEELFHQLVEAAQGLGWAVAIKDTGDDDAEVQGVVIGCEDYVDKVLDYFDKEEDKVITRETPLVHFSNADLCANDIDPSTVSDEDFVMIMDALDEKINQDFNKLLMESIEEVLG